MRVTYHSIYLFLAAMLSTTLFTALEIFGVSPNLFITYIVFAGFYVSKNEAIWLGLIFGFVYDIIVGASVGLNGILYMFACFLVVVSCESVIRRNNALVTFIFVAIWTIVLEGINALFSPAGGFLSSIKIIGVEIFYNGIIAVILYLALRRKYERLYDNEKR